MTTQSWPDPKRPGVPMFPERDGWHWISNTPNEPPFPAEWTHQTYSENKTKWFWDMGEEWEEDYEMAECYYYGPCLFPTQINEMLAAERESAAKEAEKHRSDANPHAVSDWDVVQTSTANDIAKAIRKLGAAS